MARPDRDLILKRLPCGNNVAICFADTGEPLPYQMSVGLDCSAGDETTVTVTFLATSKGLKIIGDDQSLF